MNHRIELQRRLQSIAASIDSESIVAHHFDESMFIVKAPNRPDVRLLEAFVDDHTDGDVEGAVRLQWGL